MSTVHSPSNTMQCVYNEHYLLSFKLITLCKQWTLFTHLQTSCSVYTMSTIDTPSTSSPCVNNEHCSLTFKHTVWASKVDVLKEAERWLHVRGTFDYRLGFDTLSANLHHFTWQVKKRRPQWSCQIFSTGVTSITWQKGLWILVRLSL